MVVKIVTKYSGVSGGIEGDVYCAVYVGKDGGKVV